MFNVPQILIKSNTKHASEEEITPKIISCDQPYSLGCIRFADVEGKRFFAAADVVA